MSCVFGDVSLGDTPLGCVSLFDTSPNSRLLTLWGFRDGVFGAEQEAKHLPQELEHYGEEPYRKCYKADDEESGEHRVLYREIEYAEDRRVLCDTRHDVGAREIGRAHV